MGANGMSRSKKVLTADDIKRREKSAERVKALKNEMKISYKTLADRLDLSEATIRNYAHLRSTMDSKAARLFQKLTGTIWPYWTGDTDCKSWDEYDIEQEMILDEALNEYEREQQAKEESCKSLFTLCGFIYSKLSGTAGAEYELNPNATGPHRIKDNTTGITATLNDSELQALIDRLRSTIQLECFIKSKQA